MGRLQTEDGRSIYGNAKGIPDLRIPPDRLRIDLPWHDSQEDLDGLDISFPTVTETDGLPEHLDRYLASIPPSDGQGALVLEVGCGERHCEPWFTSRGFRYLGIDVDIRGPGPTFLADAHNLPFKSSVFDYCTSMAVMEHLLSPQMMSNEVFRTLKPGGCFFGSSAFVYGFHDMASYYHMSHAGLLHTLKSSGFEIERMWPDWSYSNAIPAWAFRGGVGAPWRLATHATLSFAESTFVLASNAMRTLFGKEKIDLVKRSIEIAGSVSFCARKP